MELDELIIHSDTKITEALKQLDRTAQQILVVVDETQRLLGTITDGDIRRGILSDVNLSESVSKIMNRSPLSFNESEEIDIALVKQRQISKFPIVNKDGVVLRIESCNQSLTISEKSNAVVLMAGGLGTRLAPLTDNIPKPMLNVGEKPILETIINQFADNGFHNIYLSVNYKSDMIKAHFGSGERYGINIQYLDEQERLGTAGSLSLLDKNKINQPFFVMNADLLTDVNFTEMLTFHTLSESCASLAVREYDFEVPYGVVKTKNEYVQTIFEKPIQRFFVSAGIYILEPELLQFIPKKTFYDMPTLINKLIDEHKKVASFPIHEYWIDIGRLSEFEKANKEYKEIFQYVPE